MIWFMISCSCTSGRWVLKFYLLLLLLTVGSLNGPSFSFTACNINSGSTYFLLKSRKGSQQFKTHVSIWVLTVILRSFLILRVVSSGTYQSLVGHQSRITNHEPSPFPIYFYRSITTTKKQNLMRPMPYRCDGRLAYCLLQAILIGESRNNNSLQKQ